MKSRLDQVNGIELHSFEEGNAGSDVIIFLHGFPEYGGAWQKQSQFFAQHHYHVIAPDQRGYNLSSKFKEVMSFLVELLVADIVSLIKKLTARQVVLVGHDWGGVVGWELAMRQPELIRQLVILNMPHPAVMIQTLQSNPKQMRKSWYQGFFQLPVLPELICKSFDFKFMERALTSTAHKHTFSATDITQYKQTWRQPGALTSMINWYRAFKYYKAEDLTITVPTLLIWGKKDHFLNVGMAQSSHERCSNGQLIMLEDATHWLHHEQPDYINHLILDFIKSK